MLYSLLIFFKQKGIIMRKKYIFFIIVCVLTLALGIQVFAIAYNATFTITNQNNYTQIVPDYFEIVTSSTKTTYYPTTGYFYIPIEGGTTFGYNVRISGYATRYSPQYTMPNTNYSFSMSLLPKSTYSAYGYGYPLSYSSNDISSLFGWRKYNGLELHQGLDIKKPQGTYIYSICVSNNIVAATESTMGNYIQAYSLDGYRVRYMHMSSFAVLSGSNISKGTHIGYVGSTGNASGAHLHIDILASTQYIDPEAFFN